MTWSPNLESKSSDLDNSKFKNLGSDAMWVYCLNSD